MIYFSLSMISLFSNLKRRNINTIVSSLNNNEEAYLLNYLELTSLFYSQIFKNGTDSINVFKNLPDLIFIHIGINKQLGYIYKSIGYIFDNFGSDDNVLRQNEINYQIII
ncbi:hypothetical protein BpHYR1_015006 [Brachionus plicatilis]|uniref:Uncharacterized protein n=1 Tax=Brachionus plicatilis TaxID=10195 RepID=A0A3M7T485_BRAPC|nr:hypothetical protein BpHYR1_015006 [Brachionus plicatilis]